MIMVGDDSEMMWGMTLPGPWVKYPSYDRGNKLPQGRAIETGSQEQLEGKTNELEARHGKGDDTSQRRRDGIFREGVMRRLRSWMMGHLEAGVMGCLEESTQRVPRKEQWKTTRKRETLDVGMVGLKQIIAGGLVLGSCHQESGESLLYQEEAEPLRLAAMIGTAHEWNKAGEGLLGLEVMRTGRLE
jgi:hypothetical protein